MSTTASGPAFCTIIAGNYLARARVLAHSLARVHPEIPLYVLLVDQAEGRITPGDEPFHLLGLQELALPRLAELCFRYELVELCTAVKPVLLRLLFARGHSKLVFLDPDVRVYQPLTELLELLECYELVLTPHLTERVDDGKFPGEPYIVAVGAYNLGFLALARSSGMMRFLDWWWGRCETSCLVELDAGLFLDQKWMNLAPAVLERVHVLRHPGYNVAHWNLAQRRLAGAPAAPTVNGEPLFFFHFSSADALRPQVLACPQTRFGVLDQEPLATMLVDYSAELMACGQQTCSRWAYGHAAFDDGQLITIEMRRLFRSLPPGRFPNPFDTSGGLSFLRWALTAPARGPKQRGLRRAPSLVPAAPVPASTDVVPRLAALYEARPDLRREFPQAFVDEHDAPRFLAWLTARAAALDLDAGALTAIRGLALDQPGRRIVEIYERRSDVQRAFPEALSWPGDPDFLAWLRDSGVKEYALAADWTAWFALRRAQHVCPRVARLYGEQNEWRAHHPLGLSPLGRAAFLAWLREGAARAAGIDVSGIEALCVPHAAGLLHDLRVLYRRDTSLKQRFPNALDRPGGARRLLEWLRGEGRVRLQLEDETLERLAAELGSAGLLEAGTQVVGMMRSESGMGELARATVRSLAAVGRPVSCVEVADGVHRQADLSAGHPEPAQEPRHFPFAIVPLTAPDMLRFKRQLEGLRDDTHVVGYWPWELEVFPEQAAEAFGLVDEVWTLSRFSAAAVAALAPVPVHPLLPAVTVPEHVAAATAFAPCPSEFTFLFVYDVLSESDRKNPEALIEAFRRAFRNDDRVRLMIKTANGALCPDALARVRARADGLRVCIVDRYLPRHELLALMAACDAYVSLHRAEGFGFTLAEAMALGKPVIATYYSGNTEYMSPWNSFPVPYRLSSVDQDLGVYRRGDPWAEPDVDAAADLMRLVVRDREHARAVGARARTDVRALLSAEACGRRLAQRMDAVIGRRVAARALAP